MNEKTPPKAAEPYLIDFTQTLYSIPDDDGDPPVAITDRAGTAMTLLSAAKSALLSDLPGEQTNPPNQTEKKRRGDLARYITTHKKGCKLKAESVTLIKTCIAKLWPAAFVTITFPLLDPSDVVLTDF